MNAGAHTVATLAATPNPLARHYARFRVGDRVLLTGHSHQAWPDVSREAQLRAWDEAAEHVDDKWRHAAAAAAEVAAGFARLLADDAANVALGASTHELVVRFLSALPLAHRPRLVTTDGEFHTLRRQLDRLAETGRVQVVKVAARPAATLAARLAAELDGRTAAVFVSSVLFGNAHIVPHLGELASACNRHGAELLVDAYHHINVVPLDLAAAGLGHAFVVGGGYKYCQLGEGNCFLRVPPGREDLAPVVTGWFSEFPLLASQPRTPVPYGAGIARWAGSTYDPTSHHRAASVFAFFAQQGLTPALLREVSQYQVGRLAAGFDAADLDPAVIDRDREPALDALGGFLALRTPHAGALVAALRTRNVWADHRGDVLRLGPAPYVSDAQLDAAADALAGAVRALQR